MTIKRQTKLIIQMVQCIPKIILKEQSIGFSLPDIVGKHEQGQDCWPSEQDPNAGLDESRAPPLTNHPLCRS